MQRVVIVVCNLLLTCAIMMNALQCHSVNADQRMLFTP